MKPLLLLVLVPILSIAECKIELETIKPKVREALEEMHRKPNSDIAEDEFIGAYLVVSAVLNRVVECEKFHEEFERENYHFERWGETSNKYFSYKLELQGLNMQLEAAADSFDLGIFRPLMFDENMWEKVAKEFYEAEI